MSRKKFSCDEKQNSLNTFFSAVLLNNMLFLYNITYLTYVMVKCWAKVLISFKVILTLTL